VYTNQPCRAGSFAGIGKAVQQRTVSGKHVN
jgi:hypothetical protein